MEMGTRALGGGYSHMAQPVGVLESIVRYVLQPRIGDGAGGGKG